MSFTKEDLETAKTIIDKAYYDRCVPSVELGNLAIVLSKACIRENGLVMEPSRGATIRLIDALGYRIV